MITVIGVLFLMAGIYCVIWKEDCLLGLLIFSALFQATSVINFGMFGIQPFYLVACLFVYSQGRKERFWRGESHFGGRYLLIAFGCVGVISALVCPFIFKGIPIYSPKDGIDVGFFSRPALQFSLGNIAQATYLVVELLAVAVAASAIKTNKTKSLYDICFYCLAGLIVIQFIYLRLGISFPYSLFQNNPGYSMAEVDLSDPGSRVMGTFSEASGAGLTLAIFYGGYFYEFFSGNGSVVKVIIAAISIGLVRSSSSLAAMLVTTALIIVLHPAVRFPWFIRRQRLVKLIAVLAIGELVAISPVSSLLTAYTTEKSETLSYVHRVASDTYSVELAAQTNWIGVGLGSNRPSSLISSLLSNVGILGFGIFVLLVIQIARNAKGRDAWIRWSLFAAMVDMCLGGPDITQSWVWITLTLATYHGTSTSPSRCES